MSRRTDIHYDRVYALILLVGAAFYAYGGYLSRADFYNGIIGPQHWIYVVSGVVACLAIYLLVRPTEHEPEPQQWDTWLKRGPLCVGIALYTFALPYVGFLPAMIALLVMMGRLFGANWKQAVLSAVVMSVLCYGLFSSLLGISLGRMPKLF
jgi:putative tricarboxylic transport membrane protein